MAGRFVSPGVFTQENDLSFLPQGIAEIGAAFIGPTSTGPAFVPTLVQSQTDFTRIFGEPNPNFYTPYAVQDYLKNAARATVVRVLGLSGFDSTIYKSGILFISGNGGQVPLGVIYPTQAGGTLTTVSASGGPTNFSIYLSGSSQIVTASALSAVATASGYFANYFGTDPRGSKEGYVYLQFPQAINYVSGAALGTGSIILEDSAGRLNFSGSTYGKYAAAQTPTIRSQTIGSIRYNLFTVTTFSDGDAANTQVKVAIADVRPDPLGLTFGTFTLLVRDFSDTDTSPTVLEQFTNLTLDPSDPNYVARRIGDSKPVVDTTTGDVYFDGNYPNLSKYIYVTMDSGINNIPTASLPMGFAAVTAPVELSTVPTASFVLTRYSTPAGSSISVPNNSTYYGYNFADATSVSYLSAIPSGAIAIGSEFNLENTLDSDVSGALTSVSGLPYRKFVVPLQHGFDGLAPFRTFGVGTTITSTNTQGFDLSTAGSTGTTAYVLAINSLSNPDSIDINLVVAPGVLYQYHPYVCSQIIDLCTNRGDCFYIMDNGYIDANVATAINNVAALDTNYAAVYYPWLKVLDTSNNQNIWVPPSVLLPGAYALNDSVGAEWFAPAGLNRGGLTSALSARKRLSQDDRDQLYSGRVNPIATFPNQGIVVWGQKDLQVKESALDRINVRRLLIAVKKFIASSARYLVFEQNVDATRQRFLSIVNPYLASIQERAGLYAFKCVMDDTNNTADLIDRNILVGTIYLQPTKTAEFINLEFNVLPTGATFNNG